MTYTKLRGLYRHFGERTVLRDVSLQVPAGSTLAVLGRNGAGKSTLLRILATLLRPHAGDVLVFGEALPRRGFAVRGRLGYLATPNVLIYGTGGFAYGELKRDERRGTLAPAVTTQRSHRTEEAFTVRVATPDEAANDTAARAAHG